MINLTVLFLLPFFLMARGATFTVYKTWISGNILTASDLNSSYATFITNLDSSGIGSYYISLVEMRTTADPALGVPASLLIWTHYMHYKLIEIGKARGITLTNWDDDIPGMHAASTGTDTILATFDPALTAHTTRMPLLILAGGTNTGATTFNPNSVGAKDVKVGASALTAGQIVSGKGYWLMYDGTQYQVLNPETTSSDTVTNMPAGAYTVTAAQCTGRTTLTNAGAGASSVTPTLPVGAANHIIHFNHVDSGNLVIDPNGSQELYVDGVSLGAGVALTSTKQGSKFTLVWDSSGSKWNVHYNNTQNSAYTALTSNISTDSTYSTYVTTGVSVTLKAGISGKVHVDASGNIGCPSAANVAVWGNIRINRNSTAYISIGVTKGQVDGETPITPFAKNIEFSGLTPGEAQTFTIEWCKGSGYTTIECEAFSNPHFYHMSLRATTW